MSTDLDLLRRTVNYALGAIDTVTPELLTRPTPCSKWTLQMLLEHIGESVAAFQEAVDTRRVALFPPGEETGANPIDLVRRRLARLLDAWMAVGGDPQVAVADQWIRLSRLAPAAGLEIAVHGWDVVQASGHDRPIPADLATDLHAISSQLVHGDIRPRLFASPLIPSRPDPCEVLLAFLGRRPAPARPNQNGETRS